MDQTTTTKTDLLDLTTMTYYNLDEQPEASRWNFSNHVNLEDLKMDSNFAMLLCSLVFAIIWVIYITYYNSRLLGYIITKIINKFFITNTGYFQIGSICFNALSGKIMLRDLVYITHDYTVRIQDGYLIFRWWRSYVPKDVSEDLSHSDTRLSVVLNGFELHVYNRSLLYSNLEHLFGLDLNLIPNNVYDNKIDEQTTTNSATSETNEEQRNNKRNRPEAAMARTWRDLIPVIKVDITSSRLVFGNRLIPTTLSIIFEESHFLYSTKPAVNTLDRFMHFIKCKSENVRVMLVPSLKYTGMLDEPPRYMGEGFVLMSTNDLELYFYMDEPGIVPEEPVLITLTNGDIVESSPPQWGIDIKCGKGTNFSYGPWADRQREHLFKFFYPNDFIPLNQTKLIKIGDKRKMQSFDIRLLMQNDTTIDLLFSKDKETNAIHINVGAGSYLEITIPWLILQNGYTTKINGQLLHLDATTSLQFRDFIESETLEFCLTCHYPLIWNDHQLWDITLIGCKSTIKLIFYHKWFFQDLINDWSNKQRPDLMHFIPYTWRFNLTLKHSELITFVNQYNWIDCSSSGQRQLLENTQLGLCAHFLHLTFDLPFDEFLPETVPLNFSIQGESIDLSLFVPEFHTSRNIILNLEKYSKLLTKDGQIITTTATNKTESIPKWRNHCQHNNGWVDFWWIPIGAINIQYIYHPCPPLGPQPQADISTPVKEEILLSPIRFPHNHRLNNKKMGHQKSTTTGTTGTTRHHHNSTTKCSPNDYKKFDPTTLKADTVNVELEIGPSILLLYGTALKNFLNFKENIFGDDQIFTDMQSTTTNTNNLTTNSTTTSSNSTTNSNNSTVTNTPINNIPLELHDDFDIRNYRPLNVDVSIIMHDIQSHLLKNCNINEQPCPIILIERFGFEMKKRYDQTELQLLLSPSILYISDNIQRLNKDLHLNKGKLILSSLQIRGHAMFSDLGQRLDQDTIEYSWLIEIQLGKLSGKLTTSQLLNLLISLESLLLLILDKENDLNSPKNDLLIKRFINQNNQTLTNQNNQNNLHVQQQVQQAIQQLLQPNKNNTTTTTSTITTTTNTTNIINNNSGGGGGTNNNNADDNNKKQTTDVDNNDNNYNVHKLKYKLCRLAIDAIDFWLVESGTALQLWISPIRLANCNLHGKQVNSGLSCIIYNMSLRQLIWQSQKYNHNNNNNSNKNNSTNTDTNTNDLWLEVGCINFDPLIIESAKSLDIKDKNLYLIQQKFLKLHDEKLKKLWFLWPDNNNIKINSKCGCTGGCMFFGNNINGRRFFKPSKKDLEDGINIAAFRINENGKDPGYGQSILHDGMLIFRTPPYVINKISLQNPIINRTLLQQQQQQQQDTTNLIKKSTDKDSPHLNDNNIIIENDNNNKKILINHRRYSSTSIKSNNLTKEVPYSRLIDNNKLVDSDSKLNDNQNNKLIINVDVIGNNNDILPKNSISDSKLAVDYFNTTTTTTNDDKKKFDKKDSRYSLNDNLIDNDDVDNDDDIDNNSLLKDNKIIQRTISISSENHSEAFFSADDDDFNIINNINSSSNNSSLRNSILSNTSNNIILINNNSNNCCNSVPTKRKKFSSELNIVNNTTNNCSTSSSATATAAAGNNVIIINNNNQRNLLNNSTNRLRLSTHRSDHEIHTPEHRSLIENDDNQHIVQGLITPQRLSTKLKRSTSNRNQKSKIPQQQLNEQNELLFSNDVNNLIDSDSYSSTSYVSAIGSQEDFTLVDLHMQVNRLIIDSPMLMSSYVTHLTQLKCTNWDHTLINKFNNIPLFDNNNTATDDDNNNNNKLIYIGGHYVPNMEITNEGITSLKMINRLDIDNNSSSNNNKTPTSPYISVWDRDEDDNNTTNNTLNEQNEEELISNLSLDSNRTLIIIKLKGDLDIMISPLLLESLQKFIDAITPTLANLHPLTIINHLHNTCINNIENLNLLKQNENIIKIYNKNNNNQINLHEETIKTQLQASIYLPKINLTLLQVSIVEEIISFSALDNIKDLTCVSLFSICLDNVHIKLHLDRQAREVLQKFHRPSVVQTGNKKTNNTNKALILLGLHQNQNDNNIIKGEPIYIENCEMEQKQLIISLNIGKLNGQLRRLHNDSSILDDAIITAIPTYKSKVVFKLEKTFNKMYGIEYYYNNNNKDELKNNDIDGNNIEDKLGFIMFEFGFDGVLIKIVKKSQYEQLENLNNSNQLNNFNSQESMKDLSNNNNDQQQSFDNERDNKNDNPTTTTTTNTNTTTNDNNSVNDNNNIVLANKDNGNVSSCIIELKVVWFNFAAPPRTPITKKIDYTRLDWNLLSTASPAINAWMNPSNRLAIRVVHMVRTMYRRSTAIVACLMAEALDIQKFHMLTKSRFSKLTPLSQTLQDDPSLQLLTILQKYYMECDTKLIENNLKENELPQLFILRQGVIVLSRQWKNILYTPLLPITTTKQQHLINNKLKINNNNKPLNVTIAIPEIEEVCGGINDGETSYNEDHDITDEHARLLHSGIILKPNRNVVGISNKDSHNYLDTNLNTSQVAVVSGGIESILTSPSPTVLHRKRNKSLQPIQPPNSSRTSVVLPLLTTSNNNHNNQTNQLFSNPSKRQFNYDDGLSGYLRGDDRNITTTTTTTNYNMGSDPSDVYSHSSPELPSSPLHHQRPLHTHSTEDLYSWMAKQDTIGSLKGCMESKIDTLQTESSGTGILNDNNSDNNLLDKDIRTRTATNTEFILPTTELNLYPIIHDSVRLLDANQIFQPLLTGLGIMSQQLRFTTLQTDSNNANTNTTTDNNNVTTSLDALGSNFCLVGNMEQMRIDIIVSEYGKQKSSESGGGEKKSNKIKGKNKLDKNDDIPAFLCEKILIELEIDRMTDMKVNDIIKRKNILYISRGQLKNYTSTILNFTISVRYISQRVNMPLLRLLNQISNMYQNVKDTQNELREQQPLIDLIKRPKTSTSDHIEINNKQQQHSSISDIQETTTHNNNQLIDFKQQLKNNEQQNKPLISPSPSLRTQRPQSFAQKLRSTSKSVKGYINLNDGINTPITISSPSAGSGLDHLTISSDDNNKNNNIQIGRCWKTIYHLLDLYGNMPDTKTIKHRFSIGTYDISEHYKGTTRKYDILNNENSNKTLTIDNDNIKLDKQQQSQQEKEHTKLIVFGVARIYRTKLLATLSGLKLESEIINLHTSLTCRKKSIPISILECSLTGQIGRTMIVLLEGQLPNQQTIVKITIGKSQTLYSSIIKLNNKDKNSGLLTIGAINIDIPQHPVVLHGMVTRGSKQLSSTLHELRVTRTSSRLSRNNISSVNNNSCNIAGIQIDDDLLQQNQQPQPQYQQQQQQQSPNHYQFNVSNNNNNTSNNVQMNSTFFKNSIEEKSLWQPLVMQFSIILQSLSITAALLPSLQAQYKMDQVNSTGFTGNKAKFTIDLPHHSLSFTTKLRGYNQTDKTEANLPSEASIALPAVHVSAEYIPENHNTNTTTTTTTTNDNGIIFRQGGYLNATADIGIFEHSLTTDLLNHLVFVQKVFMKEVNEVVQKVYGGERPVPIWLDDVDEQQSTTTSRTRSNTSQQQQHRLLFSLIIKIERIQLTATTAGSSAVRLETGCVIFELSNRIIQQSNQQLINNNNMKQIERVFVKAQVDLNLSLGQLIHNILFEEADVEYQQVAFFNTRISLRNAFQDEILLTTTTDNTTNNDDNKELILIILKRPLIYIQPIAIDKAILVWLNYKNAYDYWNEKRSNLNKELITTNEKFQFGQFTNNVTTNLGTIFLQLNVEDMGICLPITQNSLLIDDGYYSSGRGAVVITLENTSISACNSGSLVSKGKFSNLCLRFADDFENSLDDWKPDMSDTSIMNLCVVSDGTYEVCSRTILNQNENAKWLLNVKWQMEGVDIHLDTNVGKQLSALGHTLTMLTSTDEPSATNTLLLSTNNYQNQTTTFDYNNLINNYDLDDLNDDNNINDLPSFIYDLNLDNKLRSKLIEKEMNEQAKIITDLRSLGASHGTIELELKRLHELETLVYKDFRRDMIQKLRKQSIKAQSIKGKFGLGQQQQQQQQALRSKSFIVPNTTKITSPILLSDHDSYNNSPLRSNSSTNSAGPSRSASLRVRGTNNTDNTKVGFDDNTTIIRQQSLPTRKIAAIVATSDDNIESLDHLNIDGDTVLLRKKLSNENITPDTNFVNLNKQQQQQQQKPQEPNIDLELDVKVFINSGKCVLHTKDQEFEIQNKLNRMRKDRSCSAGLLDFPLNNNNNNNTSGVVGSNSPDTIRRNNSNNNNNCNKENKLPSQSSTSRLRNTTLHNASLVDLTIFHIPGMDVKLHYQSKVLTSTNNESGDKQQQQQTSNNSSTIIDFDKIFDNKKLLKKSKSKTTSFDELDEEKRIEQAFKRYDSNLSLIDDKNLITTHGITNPNYDLMSLPNTKLIATSLDNLQQQQQTSSKTNLKYSNEQQKQQEEDELDDLNNQQQQRNLLQQQQRKNGIKKASLFVWMTLQSVPEETIISPHILEFLEQTLEPIPTKTTSNSRTSTTNRLSTINEQKQQEKSNENIDDAVTDVDDENLLSTSATTTTTTTTQTINYGNYVYASFPVDVIVYFHMQPSTFRFSCLPVSRVECMLQLPSLDIVFSSKRAEDELFNSEFGDGGNSIASTAIGGLSVTGCLSDFSVYIFHPYGGGKKSSTTTTTIKNESQWSPLSDSERKDSLSINVEFVKFNLSRSRMLNIKQQQQELQNKLCDQSQSAIIRFSTIIDIGSASFKYDMRRLTEILAFPKAWYRRSIVRRMFLGDLSMTATYNDDDNTIPSSTSGPSTSKNYKSPNLNKTSTNRKSTTTTTAAANKLKDFGKNFGNNSTDSTTLNESNEFNNKNLSASSWETLVLFAVNFKKLNVHMNMGNVMGNVTWLTKDFHSDGRLSIGSTGHKNLFIGLGLDSSGLDAKGGIVGGNIELSQIDTFIHIREEPNLEPDHTIGLRLYALELRLDYMATSVLMCRVSYLNVNLKDEWKLNINIDENFIPTRRPASIFMHGNLNWEQLQVMISKSTTADLLKMFNKLEEFFSQQFNSSKRAFSGFTPRSNSSRTASSASSSSSTTTSSSSSSTSSTPSMQQKNREQHLIQQQSSTINDAKHHRHWQRVLKQVAGLKLNTMLLPLPINGTVLGGTMELHGRNISLACFHGINFKSKSWALFSLKEPSITFNTEAQEIPSMTESAPAQDVHVVQTLTCSLGMSTYKTHLSMATVCKVSRTVIFPPQFKTLQEWFHYAFANSQIDEVDKFPSLEKEKLDGTTNSIERNRTTTMTTATTTNKFIDLNHTREVIFALPSLQLHLKTEHLQTNKLPDLLLNNEKPMVECSFITEFEDHIFVTVDAEAFFFLHDLITSYVKEKERVLGSGDKRNSIIESQHQQQQQQQTTQTDRLLTKTNSNQLLLENKMNINSSSTANTSNSPSTSSGIINSSSSNIKRSLVDVDIFAKDWRNYNCKTWHLEPTVRLLSVAGKYIEPYGIDYILQKLGFSHARTTIPKWMQRGCMDGLDTILAILILRMVQVVREDNEKNNSNTNNSSSSGGNNEGNKKLNF